MKYERPKPRFEHTKLDFGKQSPRDQDEVTQREIAKARVRHLDPDAHTPLGSIASALATAAVTEAGDPDSTGDADAPRKPSNETVDELLDNLAVSEPRKRTEKRPRKGVASDAKPLVPDRLTGRTSSPGFHSEPPSRSITFIPYGLPRLPSPLAIGLGLFAVLCVIAYFVGRWAKPHDAPQPSAAAIESPKAEPPRAVIATVAPPPVAAPPPSEVLAQPTTVKSAPRARGNSRPAPAPGGGEFLDTDMKLPAPKAKPAPRDDALLTGP